MASLNFYDGGDSLVKTTARTIFLRILSLFSTTANLDLDEELNEIRIPLKDQHLLEKVKTLNSKFEELILSLPYISFFSNIAL